uniref:Uncharacterized protein n=1 Tax=Ignisphaera aggregans TaxID=334771 RepID=A0A7J3Z6K0_9CREN
MDINAIMVVYDLRLRDLRELYLEIRYYGPALSIVKDKGEEFFNEVRRVYDNMTNELVARKCLSGAGFGGIGYSIGGE